MDTADKSKGMRGILVVQVYGNYIRQCCVIILMTGIVSRAIHMAQRNIRIAHTVGGAMIGAIVDAMMI